MKRGIGWPELRKLGNYPISVLTCDLNWRTRCRQKICTKGKLHQVLRMVDQAIEELEAQNYGGEDNPPARLSEQLSDLEALRHRVNSDGGIARPVSFLSHQLPPMLRWK